MNSLKRNFIFVLLFVLFKSVYGISPVPLDEPEFYGLYASANDLKRYADDLDQLGIHWFRVGGINDQSVLFAAERGFHLVPTLSMRKISLNNSVPFNQIPKVIEEWREQVQESVKRYGPDGTIWKENPQIKALPIRYWGIWNEPNIEFLNPPTEMTRVELYAQILKVAAEEISKLDTQAKIIAFNTAGGSITGKPSPDVYVEQFQYFGWRRFIRETALRCDVTSFDAVGLHPYSMPQGPEAAGVAKGLELLREIAKELKFEDKQVWYTEVGYPLQYPRNKQVRDERQQACFTTRLYGISAVHDVTQLQNMYLVDIIYSQDNTQRSFGFFTAPGKWREQAIALRTMIRLIPDPRRDNHILTENENGINAYRFRGAKGLSVIMAWNSADVNMESEFEIKGKKAVLVDMLGREIKTLIVKNGKVRVSLSEVPIYIIASTKNIIEKLVSF